MNAHGFHSKVGFGLVHAGDAISAARDFKGLPSERSCDSGLERVDLAIADYPSPTLIAMSQMDNCEIKIVESVQLKLVVDHAYGADLDVVLISPSGLQSQLARPHSCPAHLSGPCGDLSRG
jgi:hypothetical protein